MFAEFLAAAVLLAPGPARPPLRLAQSQGTNACMINCDTQSFGCRSGCIVQPIPIPSTTNQTATMPNTSASPSVPTPAQCNLTCSTQQSVCRQNCARLTQ